MSRNPLIETITSTDPDVRNRSVHDLIAGSEPGAILRACAELERFRQASDNLYERVRASMFLHAIYRYALQEAEGLRATGSIPFDGFEDLMQRRFEQAIASFTPGLRRDRPQRAIARALAQADEQITYPTPPDPGRRSGRG